MLMIALSFLIACSPVSLTLNMSLVAFKQQALHYAGLRAYLVINSSVFHLGFKYLSSEFSPELSNS